MVAVWRVGLCVDNMLLRRNFVGRSGMDLLQVLSFCPTHSASAGVVMRLSVSPAVGHRRVQTSVLSKTSGSQECEKNSAWYSDWTLHCIKVT